MTGLDNHADAVMAVKGYLNMDGGLVAGSLVNNVIKAIEVADLPNLARLRRGFPYLVDAWREVQGQSALTFSERPIIDRFARALDDGEYELPPADATELVRVAATWADAKARSDPKLGNGRDVRAIFALTEGITIGAMAWRKAIR